MTKPLVSIPIPGPQPEVHADPFPDPRPRCPCCGRVRGAVGDVERYRHALELIATGTPGPVAIACSALSRA